jgi:hypothetical protein
MRRAPWTYFIARHFPCSVCATFHSPPRLQYSLPIECIRWNHRPGSNTCIPSSMGTVSSSLFFWVLASLSCRSPPWPSTSNYHSGYAASLVEACLLLDHLIQAHVEPRMQIRLLLICPFQSFSPPHVEHVKTSNVNRYTLPRSLSAGRAISSPLPPSSHTPSITVLYRSTFFCRVLSLVTLGSGPSPTPLDSRACLVPIPLLFLHHFATVQS